MRWTWAVGPVVLYAAAIVVLSSRPELPEPGFLALLMKLFARSPLAGWFGFDKVSHFLEYALFGLLVARAMRILSGAGAGRVILATTLVGMAFGASDELHQFFVPGRDASLFDLLADTFGSLAGATGWVVLAGALRRLTGAPAPARPAREGT
ncbi:MAG TPA: VanZ family protein [Vulgatibacter sp.]|nr:VanZ family protein [Vulgatibacter sp.]